MGVGYRQRLQRRRALELPMRYRGPVLILAAKRADDVSLEDIERRFGVPVSYTHLTLPTIYSV